MNEKKNQSYAQQHIMFFYISNNTFNLLGIVGVNSTLIKGASRFREFIVLVSRTISAISFPCGLIAA